MYDESAEWLIYHPPKSVGFGHQSRVRNARKAWGLTKAFLEEFTYAEFGHICTLMCIDLDESLDQAIMQDRVKAARELFGPETSSLKQSFSWELSEKSLESAIEFALEDDKFPRMPYGPTSLYFYYRFLWLDFLESSGGPGAFNGFDGSDDCYSKLGVDVGGQRVFLQPALVFPGSWQSPKARSFLDKIEPKTPFRFRDQYFKRSIPSVKEKTHRRGRLYNLTKGWRSSSLN